jgi:hypothetical protein
VPTLAAATLAAAAACVGPIEPRLTVWDAQIAPVDPGAAALTGSLGAVADERIRRTDVSIAVANAPPSTTLPWRIRAGACDAAAGAIVGAPAAYAELVTDETGSGEAIALLGQALRDGDAYAVEVRAADDAQLLGCGSLVQR